MLCCAAAAHCKLRVHTLTSGLSRSQTAVLQAMQEPTSMRVTHTVITFQPYLVGQNALYNTTLIGKMFVM